MKKFKMNEDLRINIGFGVFVAGVLVVGSLVGFSIGVNSGNEAPMTVKTINKEANGNMTAITLHDQKRHIDVTIPYFAPATEAIELKESKWCYNYTTDKLIIVSKNGERLDEE